MRQFLDDLLKASEECSSEACLATVVATEGTAPRKEGSKMLVIGGQSLKGAVTIGGCVDSQVMEASVEVARSGIPQLLRMQLGEEDALEIGLTCAGALRVLVEPVRMEPDLSGRIKGLIGTGNPFALLTVIRSSLSSVKISAKAIVTPEGETCGSLGEEGLNQVAWRVAKDLLSKGISRSLDLDSTWKPVSGKSAAVEVFIDIVNYSPDLYVFGAGQVAVPVARLGAEVGFRVHVIDSRPIFANRERFPTASEILVGFPGEIAQERVFNKFSFAVLLAHAAKHDLPVLKVLLRSDARYIGVLGSRKRAVALAGRLKEMGFEDGEIGRIHIPVGLDIGAETPEQLAVAVVSELLMVRTGRTGGNMRSAKGILTS
ncbi:MAG: XdhC family protein [Candidatus Binatia bacterium]